VFVALVNQHAKRMRLVILPSVACPAVPYFSTLSHKWHDFRKKVLEHKIRTLIFSSTFIWNISHSKNNSLGHWDRQVLNYLRLTSQLRRVTRIGCKLFLIDPKIFSDSRASPCNNCAQYSNDALRLYSTRFTPLNLQHRFGAISPHSADRVKGESGSKIGWDNRNHYWGLLCSSSDPWGKRQMRILTWAQPLPSNYFLINYSPIIYRQHCVN
jgi:hypothetical protein